MNAFSLNQKVYDDHFRYFQQLLKNNNMGKPTPGELDKQQFITTKLDESLLQMTPGIVMLIDYSQHSYLYHSANISQLALDIDLMYQHGTTYTFSLFRKDHYDIMHRDIFPSVFKLLGEYSKKENSQDLRISYCNKMLTPSGEYKWFMHYISILSTHENEPVIGLKYMVDIDHFKKDNAIDLVAYIKNKDHTETTLIKKSIDTSINILSNREKQIMTLLTQGKTSKQIAYELCISLHTVNTHRKNILSKTNSANFIELISSTVN
jgi:DNA-binding CsgD family transcriptional regulator